MPRRTENYQEGLRITPVKLFRAGEVDEHLLDLVLANCRLPGQMRMDLQSQVSANHTAIERVRLLADRYGLATIEAAIDEILDASERRMRAVILSWPDGDYEASDYLDNDGVNDERARDSRRDPDPRRQRGSRLHRYGPAERRAAEQRSRLHERSGVYMTFQAATDPDIPPNSWLLPADLDHRPGGHDRQSTLPGGLHGR